MKATPIVMQFLVISIVALFLIPQFVKAEILGEKDITLNAPSSHASEYDETVNIANDSAKQNAQTWDPTYQGIWVGGSTPESLFKFNYVTAEIASAGSTMCLSWEAVFSGEKIMNGASDWVVRLPIYSSTDDINFATLTVYKIPSSNCYSFYPRTTLYAPDYYGVNITFTDPANTYKIYQASEKGSYLLDPADVSVTDGNDYYTVDNRLYVECRAPIIANTLYLFQVEVSYKADSRFKVYLSPNDVASDQFYNSHISTYIPQPGTYSYHSSNYSLDLGFSFDFRVGIGGNMVSKNFYLEFGDLITFYCYLPQGGMTYGYHSIMIPFRTANGSAQFGSFNIFNCDPGAPPGAFWTAYDATSPWFRDYILVSSDTALNVSIDTNEANFFEVQFMSGRDQSVTFAFEDQLDTKDGFMTSALDYYGMTSNRTDTSFVDQYVIDMHSYFAYLITDNQLLTPEIASLSSWSEKLARDNVKTTDWDIVAGILMVGGTILLVAGAIVFAPVVVLVGAGMALAGVLAAAAPTIIHIYGVISDAVNGFWNSAIDLVWNTLKGIGEFIWSVGEGIYNILKWAYEVIIEYGSILLGLLIIGVAMLLFFYPIHYQLKLWKVVLFMAQGRLEDADATMMSTAKEGMRNIRYAGRVGKRAYRGGSKGFSGLSKRFKRGRQ